MLLADSFLLQLPLEALSFLQHRAVVSVTRDFSLQMLYNRMVKFISVDEAGKGRGKKKEKKKEKKKGLVRESNPGPLAPEARIIPLDQQAVV